MAGQTFHRLLALTTVHFPSTHPLMKTRITVYFVYLLAVFKHMQKYSTADH